jgi:hypothetical protein
MTPLPPLSPKTHCDHQEIIIEKIRALIWVIIMLLNTGVRSIRKGNFEGGLI